MHGGEVARAARLNVRKRPILPPLSSEAQRKNLRTPWALHKKKTPRFREGLLGEMAGFNPPWWHSYFAGACCCPCAGAGVVEPEAS